MHMRVRQTVCCEAGNLLYGICILYLVCCVAWCCPHSEGDSEQLGAAPLKQVVLAALSAEFIEYY